MKKFFLFLTTIATIFFFNMCSNEGLLDKDNPLAERTILLTANMPSDAPTTRVDLTQDGKNILLTWVVGDDIELLFKQGSTEIKQVATVTSTSNEGKSAQFAITVPPEITAGAFDLYGVYGGNGISSSDPTKAILPTDPGSATSLNGFNDFSSVEWRRDVMLYFASKNIQTNNPSVSVLFKHLGALFSITVTNIGGNEIEDLVEARLVDNTNSSVIWAFNTDYGGEEFDLVSGDFVVDYAGDYYISFYNDEYYLYSGTSVTFWAWYPPLPEVVWPELMLELYDSNGDLIAESINFKPARTNPTMPGRAYYFYAELDADVEGDELLYFTEAPTITDPRDGNVYKITTIGDQVWMAENLRYLPSVVGPETGSETVPYYYVYGYNGTDVNAAKATANYSEYGVLYNWSAAMQGETGSNSIPSGVQGVCPEGWHLPSDAEWSILINTNLGGSAIAGGKLKETGTEHWYTPNTGATNSTGFTALPGGFRTNYDIFGSMGMNAFWYSSTDFDGNRAWGTYVSHNDSEVKYNGLTKDYAFSIRCVKDVVNVGM